MRHEVISLIVGLCAMTIASAPRSATAQPPSSAGGVAVIDTQVLLSDATASKTMRLQAEQIRAIYQQEIRVKQEEIDKLTQALAQQRATLSDDVYQQRLRELRQSTANAQSDLQERQIKLDGALRAASQKLTAAIEQVVNEVMKEQQLTVVLNRAAVIGTPTVPDITQEALKRINQRMSTVSIELPK